MAKVTFKQSGVTADWTDEHESLLELAEAEGLSLDFGCREGNCTACQQRLISGETAYTHEHGGVPEDEHILLCCSIPKNDVVIDA